MVVYADWTLVIYIKSLLFGCLCGLDEKLKPEQEKFPEEKLNALVVANQLAITDFLSNMDVKTARKKAVRVDRDAMDEGWEVGRNIDLHKGIAGKTEKPVFLT